MCCYWLSFTALGNCKIVLELHCVQWSKKSCQQTHQLVRGDFFQMWLHIWAGEALYNYFSIRFIGRVSDYIKFLLVDQIPESTWDHKSLVSYTVCLAWKSWLFWRFCILQLNSFTHSCHFFMHSDTHKMLELSHGVKPRKWMKYAEKIDWSHMASAFFWSR